MALWTLVFSLLALDVGALPELILELVGYIKDLLVGRYIERNQLGTIPRAWDWSFSRTFLNS